MAPAELTDFKDWPRIERFVEKHISMLYEDLRKLNLEQANLLGG